MRYARIFLETIEEELPFRRVAEVVGLTPQKLRQMFNPQYKVTERWQFSPLRLIWGENKRVKVPLPKEVGSYEELGDYHIHEPPFVALAKIVGKTVKVYRAYGDSCELTPLFTVFPSGKVEVAKTP